MIKVGFYFRIKLTKNSLQPKLAYKNSFRKIKLYNKFKELISAGFFLQRLHERIL